MKKLIVYHDENCPMRRACELLEGKWKLPVMYVLCVNGTLRYSQLRQALGITNVMLSNTLKDLEQAGLVVRQAYSEIPPRVDYSLSKEAMNLIPVLEAFIRWGEGLCCSETVDLCSEAEEEKESE